MNKTNYIIVVSYCMKKIIIVYERKCLYVYMFSICFSKQIQIVLAYKTHNLIEKENM